LKRGEKKARETVTEAGEKRVYYEAGEKNGFDSQKKKDRLKQSEERRCEERERGSTEARQGRAEPACSKKGLTKGGQRIKGFCGALGEKEKKGGPQKGTGSKIDSEEMAGRSRASAKAEGRREIGRKMQGVAEEAERRERGRAQNDGKGGTSASSLLESGNTADHPGRFAR